jgi:molecular chaperone GrpE
VEKLGKESALYKDKWLRAEAEMDNYKKRVHKEKLDQLKYGYETIIREILPVVDNLERAIEYSKTHAQKDSLYEGVELTLKLLKKVIEGFGVNTISTVGQLFDPNFHEGIGVEENQNYEDNVVVKEVEKGYLYNDRLIRPAKVIVGKKAVPVNAPEQA